MDKAEFEKDTLEMLEKMKELPKYKNNPLLFESMKIFAKQIIQEINFDEVNNNVRKRKDQVQ